MQPKGTPGEVQNAIAQSLSSHINKEPMFAFFVCSNEATFRLNDRRLLQVKLQFDSAD